jgi:hypothetical protein
MQDRNNAKAYKPTRECRPKCLEARVSVMLLPFPGIDRRYPGSNWLNVIEAYMRVLS